MELEHLEPIVIGDGETGTAVTIDPVTGLEISPVADLRNPFAAIDDPVRLRQIAIEIAEFAHGKHSRQGAEQLLDAAKAVLAGEEGAVEAEAQLRERFANGVFTASWLGVKLGDPFAGTLMACHALGREPRDAADGALRNAIIMADLHRKMTGESIREELEALVWRLVVSSAGGH
ncbi:MAG: hypothetical protein U0S12_03770 [Fimbriimonadales bacterium]